MYPIINFRWLVYKRIISFCKYSMNITLIKSSCDISYEKEESPIRFWVCTKGESEKKHSPKNLIFSPIYLKRIIDIGVYIIKYREARGLCVKQEGNIKYQGGKSDTKIHWIWYVNFNQILPHASIGWWTYEILKIIDNKVVIIISYVQYLFQSNLLHQLPF